MNLNGFWASIDPGLTGTGIAIWIKRNSIPVETYSLKYKTQKDYMSYIQEILYEHKVKWVIIEEVVYFSGSITGQVSTTSGATFKLSRFIGSLEMLLDFMDINHALVTPMKWKGQLDKKNTERKIRELLPNIDIKKGNDHEFDAVGIGLNVLGKF